MMRGVTGRLMLLDTASPRLTIPRMTNDHDPRRVLGYARISKATDESTSIERQREVIEATCRARGWALADIIEDVDVSATKTRLDRPGLARVREAVTAGRADTVMVWRIDRVARSVSDLAALTEEWAAAGVSLVSATEPFDMTTSAGRMLLQLLGVFAEFEAATIRDRVTAARAALESPALARRCCTLRLPHRRQPRRRGESLGGRPGRSGVRAQGCRPGAQREVRVLRNQSAQRRRFDPPQGQGVVDDVAAHRAHASGDPRPHDPQRQGRHRRRRQACASVGAIAPRRGRVAPTRAARADTNAGRGTRTSRPPPVGPVAVLVVQREPPREPNPVSYTHL